MDTIDILTDAFGRIKGDTHRAADGRTAAELAYQPDPEANSIAWLVWHLTRVQDHHIGQLAHRPQAYVVEGWADRLGTDPDPENHGYGHTPEQVAAIRPDSPDVLLAYHDVVTERTLEYIATVTPEELDRIFDHSWDPPVSVGVRIVSVINDCMQHAGEANYLRGLLERMDQEAASAT